MGVAPTLFLDFHEEAITNFDMYTSILTKNLEGQGLQCNFAIHTLSNFYI